MRARDRNVRVGQRRSGQEVGEDGHGTCGDGERRSSRPGVGEDAASFAAPGTPEVLRQPGHVFPLFVARRSCRDRQLPRPQRHALVPFWGRPQKRESARRTASRPVLASIGRRAPIGHIGSGGKQRQPSQAGAPGRLRACSPPFRQILPRRAVHQISALSRSHQQTSPKHHVEFRDPIEYSDGLRDARAPRNGATQHGPRHRRTNGQF